MGSGERRKGSDILRVNRPQKPFGGSGGVGGGGAPVDINRMCPAAFDVAIKPKQRLPELTPVTVKGTERFVVNEYVGRLSEKHLKIITECGAEGIRYIGRVLNRGNKSYARFAQNVQG